MGAWADFDEDGWPDLIVTNGTDFDATADPRGTVLTDATKDPTTLFRNRRDGTFANITTSSGINDTGLGRAVVVMDIDNDGDEDLVITNVASHPVVYRSDAAASGNHLVNLSTRARVGTDAGILIGGFVLQGTEPTPLLIRGIGPGLVPYGVSQVLADPKLTLFHQRTDGSWEIVATNDDWSAGDRASLIADAAKKTGAFPLNADSKDAAVFVQLPAGITVHVSGVADAQGVALLELYHVK